MLKGPQFDHERARKLHAEGKNLREISSIIGVARTSIRRVVDPEYREREIQYKKDIREGKRPLKTRKKRAETGVALIPIAVAIRNETVEILDQEAEKRDTSRSSLVREAIEQWMEREQISKHKSRGWRRHDAGASWETRTARDARQNPDHPE